MSSLWYTNRSTDTHASMLSTDDKNAVQHPLRSFAAYGVLCGTAIEIFGETPTIRRRRKKKKNRLSAVEHPTAHRGDVSEAGFPVMQHYSTLHVFPACRSSLELELASPLNDSGYYRQQWLSHSWLVLNNSWVLDFSFLFYIQAKMWTRQIWPSAELQQVCWCLCSTEAFTHWNYVNIFGFDSDSPHLNLSLTVMSY